MKPSDHPEFFRFPPPEGRSRESTIVLTKDGRFFHEGAPVTHAGMRKAFASWLSRHPDDGRHILTNGYETNDTPGMSLLGRGYYAELLAVNAELAHCPNRDAGVEIWEWHGREPGTDRQTQGLLHAKFAIVDRRLALVGSYNLDPRSERLNSESAIVFESDALAGQLWTLVERDLATARRITAAEAATFEKPAAILQRFKKELAGLLEDNY